MWCRRSCGTPGYEKSPSVLPPWGFFHKSTVPIIPLKTSHSVSSFAPKGRFGACKCKHSVNFTSGKMVPPDFVDLNKIAVGMFWQHQYGMRHPGDATAMVPKSPIFLTRPLIFRAGGGKPFKKIDT